MKQDTGIIDINLFEEIGNIVMEPIASVCNIVDAALNGKLPEDKDITTIVGAIATLWLITRIF
jgi:hypothetical protein